MCSVKVNMPSAIKIIFKEDTEEEDEDGRKKKKKRQDIFFWRPDIYIIWIEMAALGGDLRKQILGHSDAEKAFRPWWDNLEDGIMYSLVVMGKEI